MIVFVGFRWQLWFNDSWSYVESAVRHQPHVARPNGYAFLLQAFRPFHAYWPVILLQHLLALAAAVIIYALLLRRGSRRWTACLAAAPLLLDAYELQLEHMVLSDTLFLFFVLAAAGVLLWPGVRGPYACAGVGALLAAAALTRSIGLALVPIVLLWMVRRTGWRSFAALLTACVLPLTAYAFWFSSVHGRFALTNSDGPFLYARSMAFADCSRFTVPAEELPLCDLRPRSERPSSQFYVWGADSPLARVPGDRFSPRKNELAGDFARRAIAAQPLDFLKAAASDVLKVFRWDRTVYPDDYTYSQYRFGTATKPVQPWAEPSLRAYTGGSLEPTTIVRPWATIMEWYQRYFFVRGTMLLALLLVPLVRLRWDALLPWAFAWAFLVVPAVTVEFDYRYVVPAVPLAALAAALCFTPREPAE
ncbi:hypothetical protein [Actinocorallia longicatena]|uniref:hypothetical protein n=1 Tax=Actinocorallia longicatena TaxID=111803 RepID=UPI0031DFFCF7